MKIKLKPIILSLLFLLSDILAFGQIGLKGKNFIDELLNKMTLEEKIGQLNLSVISGGAITGTEISRGVDAKIEKGLMGGVFGIWDVNEIKKIQDIAVKKSRLHIPLLFGLDVIHGHKTTFPVPIALSCSWDTLLLKNVARISALEAANDGIDWVYSPMVDISRDPRWGRVVEGAGEDPFLGAQISKAMVEGYQGNNLNDPKSVMACVKHFALYGAAIAGREYNSVDMSFQQMYQYYLPPYKAAVDAGVGSVMSSFNDLNGLPSTANKWLLSDLLRKKWGFNGFVVSDYSSVAELMIHGLGDAKTVAALALNAGTDMEMVGDNYINTIKESYKEGKVTLSTINAACRRILEAKYRLGLFQDPYKRIQLPNKTTEQEVAENREASKIAAEKSFVLLKNENQILPLQPKGKIALIGPLADSKINMMGAWNIAGNPDQAITILDGLRAVAPDASIVYEKGANISDDSLMKLRVNSFKQEISIDKRSSEQMIKDAIKTAKDADVIVAVLGEASDMTGESASRSDISIPQSQRRLLKALKTLGKPIVLVLMNGRPLTLNWESKNCDAILDIWFPGIEAGNAVADVLFDKYNPSGKLTMTFPKSVGQIPIYYNHKRTGRPFNELKDASKYKSDYLDISNEPLYPFGYGLSYTQFGYGPVRLSNTQMKGEGKLDATVLVTNTGKYAGEETVQLYITDPVARITRSIQDLKGFKKIWLKPNESKDVSFTISTDDLKYFDYNLRYDWDPGEFIIRIGTNSKDTKSASVQWKK